MDSLEGLFSSHNPLWYLPCRLDDESGKPLIRYVFIPNARHRENSWEKNLEHSALGIIEALKFMAVSKPRNYLETSQMLHQAGKYRMSCGVELDGVDL
jgi:hypothetical protein